MLEQIVSIFTIVGSGVAIFLGLLKINEWRSKPRLVFEKIHAGTGIYRSHTFYSVYAQHNVINKGKKPAKITKLILQISNKEEINVEKIDNFSIESETSILRNDNFTLSNYSKDILDGKKICKIIYVDIFGKRYVAELGELAFEGQSL